MPPSVTGTRLLAEPSEDQLTTMTAPSPGENAVDVLPSIASYVGTWIVAHCEDRFEDVLVAELTGHEEIPSFWPRQEYIRVNIDRYTRHIHRRRCLRSLFPGYVSFCYSNEGDQYKISSHKRVMGIIWESRQAKFLKEISLVEAALAANPRMNSYPVSVIGERCRVKAGPYMGSEGELAKIAGEEKFIVLIEAFGRKVEMTIDPLLLEAI